METKTGKIKTITESHGSSNKGPWTRYLFEFEDGGKYSTFDEKIGKSFKPSQNVEIGLEQSGKFKNLKTMKLVENVTSGELNIGGLLDNKETNDLLRQILAELKKK